MMTIVEAREVLGKEAEKLSDEQLKEEIATADFLSEIFLDLYLRNKLKQKVTS